MLVLDVTTLDLLVIGFYLLFMLLVGVWFVKRIKNTDDYYVAGRTLGPLVLAATVCATIIGGSAMMGRAGIAYTTGFKAAVSSRWVNDITSSPSPSCLHIGLALCPSVCFH